MYIVGRSVAQGRRAGVLSVAGISTGSVIHTIAAAFGLSAILATSANAFLAVKLAGAAYLVYLGVKMLRAPAAIGSDPSTPLRAGPHDLPRASAWGIYRAAVLTNVLNPKVALFFLAFLPQFVSTDAASKVLTFLFLGAVFTFNGTLWCLVLVWIASAASRTLRQRPEAGRWFNRVAGVTFMGLGVKMAVSR